VKDAVTVPALAEDLGAKLLRFGDRWRGECLLCGNGANSGAFSAVERGWHCFACDEGGDVVTLAALANDMPPTMAASWIADRFGVRMPERPPAWYRKQRRQASVREAIDGERVEHVRLLLFRLVWMPWLRRLPEFVRDEATKSAWESTLPLARQLYEQRREA
jgi:hypothetical protein